MREVLFICLLVCGCTIGPYLIGRYFIKGILKGLDLYLGEKFVNYVNKNKKEDGKEKE